MAKHGFKMRYLAFFCALFLLIGITFWSKSVTLAAEKEISWTISLWGGRSSLSIPLEEWAELMEKQTNGRWKIKLQYGGVLCTPKNQLDCLKAGMFEVAMWCPDYTPGKNPLHMIHSLPFLSPLKQEHINQMWLEMWEHPALKKELLKWNAVPLHPAGNQTYEYMGTKRIETVENLKGKRIRLGADMAKVLEPFGAVPTMVAAPEAYEAIARGTIDGVAFPPYAMGHYKIYEVSKYLTDGMALGAMHSPFIANKTAWDALPEQFKKYHMEWYKKAPKKWHAAYQAANEKWYPIFKEKLEIIKFPESERNKLVSQAQTVYDEWVRAREKEGLPGREALDYYLKKRKEIAGY